MAICKRSNETKPNWIALLANSSSSRNRRLAILSLPQEKQDTDIIPMLSLGLELLRTGHLKEKEKYVSMNAKHCLLFSSPSPTVDNPVGEPVTNLQIVLT